MKNAKVVALAVIGVLICSGFVLTARSDTSIGDARYISPGIYYGNLNLNNTIDWWNFTAYETHRINVTMIPPANADFQLELYDPAGGIMNGSYNGMGQVENVLYTADSGGNWTIRVSRYHGEGTYTLILAPVNYPPEIPAAPLGPAAGYVYTTYYYNTSTIDSENDKIKYQFSWGDTTSNLTSLYNSGQTAILSHQWTRPQTYNVTTAAQDEHLFWSDSSTPTSIALTQNDGGSGRDAGGNPATAVILPVGSYVGQRFNSWGTLYTTNPQDPVDFFNFTVQVGDRIHAEMTPPPGADFQLELHGPLGFVNGSYKGIGQMESLDYIADLAGNWSIRISRYIGEGKYTFALSVNVGWHLILKASVYPDPPETVTFWVDGVAYAANSTAPVNLWLPEGTHTIEAQDGFVRQIGQVYYWYYFYRWSDGVTSNLRVINLTQDTTLTATYVRSLHGWL